MAKDVWNFWGLDIYAGRLREAGEKEVCSTVYKQCDIGWEAAMTMEAVGLETFELTVRDKST